LREKGLKVDVIASTGPGHAVQLAREAYDQGYRRFLAVGGDGTLTKFSMESLRNAGRFRELRWVSCRWHRQSFLRDFTKDGAAASMQALTEGRTRTVDLLRLTHATAKFTPSIF